MPRALRTAGARIFGTGVLGEDVIRVPWEQVDGITSVIRLKAKATELGLAQGDEEAARFVRKLPNS
jgi:hypothetical protein